MSSASNVQITRAIVLSFLMLLMTQVGFVEQFNSISSEERTPLSDETPVFNTGSNFSTLTSPVDGAALSFGVAMTPITLNYTSQAPPTSVSSGNNTTWEATCASSTCSLGQNGVFREAGNYLIYADQSNMWATDASREYWLLKSGITRYHTSMNNMVYFESNNELWKTDGTISGTVKVSSINPFKTTEFQYLEPSQEMTVLNNEMYFPVQNATYGAELWKSDGTDSGTVKVLVMTNYSSGMSTSIIERFWPTVFNNKLVFMGHNHTTATGHKWQLISTDGTASGTSVLYNQSGVAGLIGPKIEFQNELYFQAYNKSLMKTDGTASGTTWVFDQKDNYLNENSFIVWENHLYFNGWDVTNYTQGQELWKTDGTTNGTVQVADFVAGTQSQQSGIGVPDFYAWNETHFAFNARTSQGQNSAEHLYITDGTENNTSILTNGRYWTGRENGKVTGSGTQLLYEEPAWIGDIAYYGKMSTHGTPFCYTDFSGAQLQLTASVSETCFPGYANGQHQFDHGVGAVYSWNDELYIVAYRPDVIGNSGDYAFWSYAPGNVTLNTSPPVSWETDPALPAGISISNGIISGTPSVYANNQTYTVYANQSGNNTTIDLWFSVEGLSPASTTVSLTNNTAMTPITYNWVGSSSGNTAYNGNNTVWLASDVRPGTPNGGIEHITALGSRLYFRGNSGDGNGSELYAYDPANNTSWMVADINPSGNSEPRHMFALGTRLYFSADDGTHGYELWAYEETNDTAWMVNDTNPSGDGHPTHITLLGTRIYFRASDQTHGYELWAYEESNDTAWMVDDTNPGAGNGNWGSLVASGTRLYFSADDGTNGRELWAYEETNDTAWMVADIHPTSDSTPSYIVASGTRLYFQAENNSAYGKELWAYEETNDTAWMVDEFNVGNGDSRPANMIVSGSRLYFSAQDGTNGYQVWTYEETNDTAWMITDDQDGVNPSYPPYFGVLGTRIFFDYSATWTNQPELWSYEETNDTTWRIDRVNQVTAYPSQMIVLDNKVYFKANDDVVGAELWAYDPAGVTVSGQNSGPNNGPVTNATCEISPTLPIGITLTQGTCTISGTPTVTQSSTTYTLWVNDSGFSYSAIVDITIDESTLNPPSILPASTSVVLTNTTAMTPISFSNSGGAVDSWEVDPALPDGLSLASGTISGTPTTVQTAADYTVWANNTDGDDSAIVTITVNELLPDPPSIVPASISVVLTNTTAMSPIEFTNSGGIIDTWEISPDLPSGLAFDTSNGTISGTPTIVQAASDYTVWANNTGGSDSAIVTITINELLPDPPSISPASITVVLINTTEMTPIEFTNSGGIIDTWEISPDLPSGLAFDTSNGTISGTPTIVQAASDYTVWANNTGGSDSAIVTITINELLPDPPLISPASITVVLINTTEMTPIEFTNSGGIIDTWEISPALSPGLTINTDNGTISGTPTTVENAIAYTVWANNTGGSDSAIVTITVEEILPDPPEISYESPVVLTQYQQMTTIVPTNTGGDVDTWEISPALSSGLTMNSVDGTISGIPLTVENAIAYTIWANNTGGSDSAVVVITVEVAPDGLSTTSPNITLVRDVTMPAWYFIYIGDNITSWEISPDLPPGLIFDFANNSIIGTPTEIMNATVFTIWANSSIITESINVTIEVLEDTDGDGLPDDLGDRTDTGFIEDLDDDADGISDEDELSSIPLTDSLLPDTDGDGRCDGATNVTIRGVQICEGGPDLFPTDPSAWQDTDGDGEADDVVGNSTSEPPLVEDLDDDNDGLSDVNETIEGSLTDSKLPDTDYDGVCDGEIEVWFNGELICTAGPDAFPDDPTEWIDTDDDGLGNNADLDDDGDQASDLDEIAADTDPLDPLDFPTDDADGDGWTDSQEDFCGTDKLDNMSIPTDNDADLWCDSDDPDDDNDGWFDTDEDDCGTDSLDFNSVPGDADGDGLCDSLEVVIPDVDDGGFPWWLCFLFLIAIIIILPLILRSKNDAEPENTTVTPEVVGTGLLEDPFILTPVEGIDPGEIVLSEETIAITNMSPEMKVHINDLNKNENGRRFLLVDEMISEEGVPMIVASEEGSVEFRLSFDDSADPSLAGGDYDSMLKVGNNSVYFKWNVAVDRDPDYVEEMDETIDDDEDDENQSDSEESEKDSKKAEEEAKAAKAEIKKAEASMTKEEKKAAGIERVKAKAAEIDFTAIGVATMDDRDDLQSIKGVGPFLEEKLNALGIYTFEQISKMSSELEDQVNIAIEFFPGRVKRDKWVDQCKAILNED